MINIMMLKCAGLLHANFIQRREPMSNVKRVYVEKKPEFAVAAKELRHEIRHYLGITDVTGVRVLIRYDAEKHFRRDFQESLQRRICGAPCGYPVRRDLPCE